MNDKCSPKSPYCLLIKFVLIELLIIFQNVL